MTLGQSWKEAQGTSEGTSWWSQVAHGLLFQIGKLRHLQASFLPHELPPPRCTNIHCRHSGDSL